MPHLITFLRSPQMQPLATVIQTELVQTGVMRNAEAALLTILHNAPPPPGLTSLLEKVIADPNTAPVSTLIGKVLEYLAGVPPETTSHYAVTTALANMLSQCNQNGPLVLVDTLVTTYLPLGCTPNTAGCDLASSQLLLTLGNLLASPSLAGALANLNLGNTLPEASFITLSNEVISLLENPNFDFGQVRAVVANDLFPLISDATLLSNINNLLDILDQMTQPQTGVLTALQGTLSCVTAQDPTFALDSMVYDLVTDPNIELAGLLTAIVATGNQDPSNLLSLWLHQLIGLLQSNQAANEGLITFAVTMLENTSTDPNASRVIPVLIEMGQAGVLKDLVNMVRLAFDGCSNQPIKEPQ